MCRFSKRIAVLLILLACMSESGPASAATLHVVQDPQDYDKGNIVNPNGTHFFNAKIVEVDHHAAAYSNSYAIRTATSQTTGYRPILLEQVIYENDENEFMKTVRRVAACPNGKIIARGFVVRQEPGVIKLLNPSAVYPNDWSHGTIEFQEDLDCLQRALKSNLPDNKR